MPEYIPTLKARQNWIYNEMPLMVGSLVPCTEHVYVGSWLLGSVEQVITVSDDPAKMVNAITANGTLNRDLPCTSLLECEYVMVDTKVS